METQKRIAWIDMAKGYGMILVILGHCGVGDLVNWINSFHMPLFFFLSGYVFNPTGDFKTFIKKKARSILIPYLGLGIPLVLYSGLCQYIHSGSLTVAYIIHLVSGFVIQRRMYGCPPLTYLSAFAGIACVVIVSKWITIKPIQYIGENSILYFAWHQTMVIPFSVQCLDLLHMSLDSTSSLGEFVIYKIAQLLIILAILTLCNFLISRTRLRILLRK